MSIDPQMDANERHMAFVDRSVGFRLSFDPQMDANERHTAFVDRSVGSRLSFDPQMDANERQWTRIICKWTSIELEQKRASHAEARFLA